VLESAKQLGVHDCRMTSAAAKWRMTFTLYG
jgi:hypothetical protein